MLSMFRQLSVKELIPFLETFETTKTIDNELFIDFEKELNDFILSLETYLDILIKVKQEVKKSS